VGNLYGTTSAGGADNFGTVFMLDKAGAETILYNLAGQGDGEGPSETLTRDTTGILYSTTSGGGGIDGTEFGTVFMIKP
jgi:uncharacterized repeat protein (TIGR03803 family)